MKASYEEQKAEALERMRLLQMSKTPIRDFDRPERRLHLSENGGLYWLDEEQKKMVQKWEEATGNVVYHVIHDFTQIGELYSLLFVSRDKEEWLADRRDINDGIALSYVVNVSYPDCSEYGSIAIRPLIGGVMRLF